MLDHLWSLLDTHYSEMVEIRRYLHMHPEVSFKEVKTASYIVNYYEILGVDVGQM